MRTQSFGVLFVLMLLGQMILCNFAGFSPYVMLTLLPAMIICVPLTVSTPMCMLIAFASGLSVDWLSEGIIGLNASALIPVSLMRKPLIRFFLGEDLIVRSDSFSFRKNGTGKISLVMGVSLVIFLSIYIFLDGAGTRPVWFNMTRFGVSFVCNMILALIVTNILTVDDRK